MNNNGDRAERAQPVERVAGFGGVGEGVSARLAPHRKLAERVIDDVIRDGRQWYLLSTIADTPRRAEKLIEASRAERKSRLGAAPFAIELYYPYTTVMQKIARKFQSQKQRRESALCVPMKPVKVSLFPGYLFAQFDAQRERWRDLFHMTGIRGIELADGKPVPLRAGVVEALRALEVGGVVPGDTPLKALPVEVGEMVRVSFGPFAGFNATVAELPDVRLEDLDESARLKLLVDLFGRQTAVVLSFGDIERL